MYRPCKVRLLAYYAVVLCSTMFYWADESLDNNNNIEPRVSGSRQGAAQRKMAVPYANRNVQIGALMHNMSHQALDPVVVFQSQRWRALWILGPWGHNAHISCWPWVLYSVSRSMYMVSSVRLRNVTFWKNSGMCLYTTRSLSNGGQWPWQFFMDVLRSIFELSEVSHHISTSVTNLNHGCGADNRPRVLCLRSSYCDQYTVNRHVPSRNKF